ncbi:MAG: sigma-70 family RNA polymerase sigma factor [Phycisphaeraceae bacterium]|nr:sigma-70 family RNA polymerase sigma factor [Phycisphaeraceae bacterium]
MAAREGEVGTVERRAERPPPTPSEPDAAAQARRAAAERWLVEHGDVLWRFVLGRVRSPVAAEDIVQETLLAAMQSRERFEGASTERTWLLGIAVHKIGDHLRKRARTTHRSGRDDDAPCACEVCRALFSGKGMWQTLPREWDRAGPGETPAADGGEKDERRRALVRCIDALPEGQRDAMWMRDVLGVPSEEVRKAMGLTPTNLWTRLHRARSAVRSCLEAKLLGRREGGAGRSGCGSDRGGAA